MIMQVCPISRETRNEHVVRVVAALVSIITAGALAVGPPFASWILGVLAADFAVRGFGRPRYSPLATLGRIVVNAFRLPPEPVDAAPKRFAARIGIVFSSAAALLFAIGAPLRADVIGGVLIACALLEAAFALCIGCKVYALLPDSLAQALVR